MAYFPAFVFSAVLTLFLTPLIIPVAKRYGLVDDPRRRFHPAHVHTGIIPRAGGLALFAGSILPIIVFNGFTKTTFGLILAGTLLTVVGIMDDKHDVNPWIRLGTNSLAALIVVLSGVGIPYVTNPIMGGVIHLDTWRVTFELFGTHSILVWADVFAFVWILWTINIIGWSAGVDGQMPGFVTIAAVVLGLLSLRVTGLDPSQMHVTVLAAIVAGTFLGFLPWNFFPQKIMPGYSGKTLAGLYLAVLGILSYGKVGTALLVLGVPTIDAAYTLMRRIASRKSPVRADRLHLHHQLLDLGWGKRRVALFYWSISAILGAVALTVKSQQKFYAFLLAAVLFGGFILWVKFFTQFSSPPDRDSG